MKFWTFAGDGISTRFAEQWLIRLDCDVLPHGTELGLPTQPDHMFHGYYQTHAPLLSVANAKDVIRNDSPAHESWGEH